MDKVLKKSLKEKAHHLKPVVLLGSKGLTANVIEEIKVAIFAHELIKIKINGFEKEDRQAMADDLCAQLNANLIQAIGNTITIYKMREQ